jgi:multiple sugar transport system substrate-binding protein
LVDQHDEDGDDGAAGWVLDHPPVPAEPVAGEGTLLLVLLRVAPAEAEAALGQPPLEKAGDAGEVAAHDAAELELARRDPVRVREDEVRRQRQLRRQPRRRLGARLLLRALGQRASDRPVSVAAAPGGEGEQERERARACVETTQSLQAGGHWRRVVWSLIAAAVSAAALAGCGGGSGDGDGEIRFLVFGEPEELRAFRAVVREFRVREPDARVRLVEASDRNDLLARLSTSFAGGSPPDLFLLNYRFYGQFAARGVLEPVEERLRDSESLAEEDFYPQALEAFRFDGRLVCLPQNISSLVVYYNKDLFRSAGVAEPEPDWSWNDMVAKAVRLTADTDEDGTVDRHGLAVEPSIIRVAPFVWSNGGELFDDPERPTRFALDARAREALDAFFDLRRLHLAVPSEEEAESEDEESRFLNGRVAMVLSSRRATPTFRTIAAFDWDVAPLPRHTQRAGILHSDAYCLTKASRDKDLAWRFMEFALGPRGQRVTARSGRTVPSLVEVSRSPAFLDPDARPASSHVFLDGIPDIRRVPTISTWPEIEDATAAVLEGGLYENVPTDEVVRQLDATTRDIFSRARR